LAVIAAPTSAVRADVCDDGPLEVVHQCVADVSDDIASGIVPLVDVNLLTYFHLNLPSRSRGLLSKDVSTLDVVPTTVSPVA